MSKSLLACTLAITALLLSHNSYANTICGGGDDSLKLNKEITIKAFPNPTSRTIRILIEVDVEGEFETVYSIGNVLGQKRKKGKVRLKKGESVQIDVDVSTWKTGVYFVHVHTPTGIKTKTFYKTESLRY